jgi:hypothetical protein
LLLNFSHEIINITEALHQAQAFERPSQALVGDEFFGIVFPDIHEVPKVPYQLTNFFLDAEYQWRLRRSWLFEW